VMPAFSRDVQRAERLVARTKLVVGRLGLHRRPWRVITAAQSPG
jgi:hypothetical protein